MPVHGLQAFQKHEHRLFRETGHAKGYPPLPLFLPPNPPLPRSMTVLWFSNNGLPVDLSVVVVTDVTVAALPLSRTSMSFTSLTRVALVGIGPKILRYCSPCRSLA